jgi:hypothetical protein
VTRLERGVLENKVRESRIGKSSIKGVLSPAVKGWLDLSVQVMVKRYLANTGARENSEVSPIQEGVR